MGDRSAGFKWMDHARCVGVDPDLFYPSQGQPALEARMICGKCIVRAACLRAALARREQFGIWGGTSERERRRMRPGDVPAGKVVAA